VRPSPDLLAAAERLFREGGAEALTMDALAAAAGVSRATVYRQVKSREALLAHLAEQGLDVGEREGVRARILKAAGQVFAQLGFEAATVEAIAEAAGAGAASVYRHFGDKRGLVAAYLDAHAPRRAAWGIAHEPSGDLRADLEGLIVTLLTRIDEQRDLMRLALLERLKGSTLLDEVGAAPERTIHAITALLSVYVERGDLIDEDPALMARALQGLIFSFGLGGTIMGLPGSLAPEPAARFIVRLFLDGLGRKGTTRGVPKKRRNS
jgi:AcrR family transcriptional regulator